MFDSDEESKSVQIGGVSPRVGGTISVEDALAFSMARAAEVGRFDVVAQIAKELEARRLAASGNVVVMKRQRPEGS